ncbi:MAG: serine/threonine-protein kinase [Pseudomonadota bacterium]
MTASVLDWARVTTLVEHALTLDDTSIKKLLTDLNDDQAAEVERLLRRMPPKNFLATSADDDLAQQEQLKPGSLLGPWKVLEHIGQGGMGDIYKAVRADGVYEQTVALKLIQGLAETRTALFEAERRRLALMDHPNIARIIDGGQDDQGLPYMAMEFVDGQPINQHVLAHRPAKDDVLRTFLAVCAAVAHAHSRLILHRDIKAENVLVPDNGDPRLIDFGIATSLEDDGLRGGPLTLATAAPEQLKGEPVSVQTDVFSLGVLLHELATGERPTRLADGGMAAADLARGELAAILRKALAADPQERYASAEELHDEVLALLDHRPVAAIGGGRGYAARKFLQRNPLASGFAAAAVLSLVAGLGTSLKFAADAQAEAERAVAKQLEAEENLERSEFFHQRAERLRSVQTTFSNLQQSMYAGEADVERQTRIFLERWREAHARSDEESDEASRISYAVGRHFLFRNDYPTAIEVLSGWIEKGYGPEDMLLQGRQFLAIAYTNTGRGQEALPLLRDVEAWRASSFEAGLPDHIATATQIADITRDPADIKKAEDLLLNGIENHNAGSYVIAYYWQRLAVLREMGGDFAGALEARRKEMDVVVNELQLAVENSDSARLGLARFELFYEKNIEGAAERVDEVIEWTLKKKGESRVLGQAYLYKALIHDGQGNLDQALEMINASVDLMIRFSTPTSSASLTTQMHQAELLAQRDAAKALEILTAIQPAVGASESEMTRQRYRMAEILVKHLAGEGPPGDSVAAIDFNLCGTSLMLDYTLRKLERLGLVERPSPPAET